MQLCCSLYVVVAASLVFRQLGTNTNIAISTTQLHTMSLVLLITRPLRPGTTLSGSYAALVGETHKVRSTTA